MNHLLREIARADEVQIEQLLNAVIARYAALYPEWEISTISIQKTGERNRQIDNIIQMLQHMKSIAQ